MKPLVKIDMVVLDRDIPIDVIELKGQYTQVAPHQPSHRYVLAHVPRNSPHGRDYGGWVVVHEQTRLFVARAVKAKEVIDLAAERLATFSDDQLTEHSERRLAEIALNRLTEPA